MSIASRQVNETERIPQRISCVADSISFASMTSSSLVSVGMLAMSLK